MSLNKAMIIGNLGRDPEMRYTPSGQAVTQFTVAVNRNYKDQTGEWQEETEWFRVVVWGQQAERAAEYLRKGNKVYVEGRLQTRQWEDQSGQKRYTTELVANQVTNLERRTRDESEEGARRPVDARPARRPRRRTAGRRRRRREARRREQLRRPALLIRTAASPHAPQHARAHRILTRCHPRPEPKKRDDYYRDRRRRKVCAFCADKTVQIDYKEVNRLRRYLSERAKIEPRRKTGTCAGHQRELAVALKRARHVALLPYAPQHLRP